MSSGSGSIALLKSARIPPSTLVNSGADRRWLRAAPTRLVVAALATAVLVFGLTYWLMRWGVSQLGRAAADPRERRWLTVFAGLLIVIFLGQKLGALPPETPTFPAPVSHTYLR